MKRMRYRPSKGMCIFAGIWGLVFVGIGIFVVIPQFGPFGILWTLMAGAISGYYFAMAAGKVKLGAIELEDEPALRSAGGDTGSRLQELRDLCDRSLITREEYEEKRKEILKEL